MPDCFDRRIDRKGTYGLKHDGALRQFGCEVLPLWVADMDFAAPDEVKEALLARAAHPVYGYTFHPDEFFAAVQDWLQMRHGWQVERQWIVPAPGVVPSLHAAVRACTMEGDGVIVQTPVYFPFIAAVNSAKRVLVENPLRLVGGSYEIDFAHLEQCAQKARLLLFCSPHNPVGRVWRRDELERVASIAAKYGLLILSDEIHSDLVYPGQRHIPLSSLGKNVITALSPSKTFNIPGLGQSALIVEEGELREKMGGFFSSLGVNSANPFSVAAFIAAYRFGAPWLEKLLAYLQGNLDFAMEFIATHLAEIVPIRPEGTFLLWLDCRKFAMRDDELARFFVHEAQVGLSGGINFGREGSGFMRINLACRREVLLDALTRIARALGRF